jgi:hypothetical protein
MFLYYGDKNFGGFWTEALTLGMVAFPSFDLFNKKAQSSPAGSQWISL